MGIVTLTLLVGVFYLLLWYPQYRRSKNHRELMNGLQKGDEIITVGGLLGKIAKIEDDFITLTISPNVDISIQRDSVTATIPKGTLK
ncbi:MAG: preprotein translocase subunit YajC [Gammaproteobacteria bacterium]|nr:preprotein translocase subunit YajC [Gammaproteobacteria bacterium]